MKDWSGILKNLGYLSQLGISVALPIVFFAWFSSYLTNRFNLPYVIIPIAILLGLCVGAINFYKFIKIFISSSKKDKDKQ